VANGLGTNEQSVREAVRIAVGTPELVVVDARVLRLLMGDLANLIILGQAHDGKPGMMADRGQEHVDEIFVWDRDSLCP